MSEQPSPSSRLPVIAAAVVVIAVLVGGAVFLFGGDDPAEVDSSAALEQADAADADAASEPAGDGEGDGDSTAEDAEDDADVDAEESSADEEPSTEDGGEQTDEESTADETDPAAGTTWTVDTEAVEYSFDDGAGTFVGFRIDEELSSVGQTEAVGRTPEVEGQLTIDGTTVTAASFTGDARALTTDRSQRDGRTRSALGDGMLVFELTEPIELDSEPAPGETVSADGTGDLTVNGVTQSYTVPLEASLSESGVLVVTSSFDVTLADHDVEAPQAGPVLSVSDVATVEVQLFMRSG